MRMRDRPTVEADIFVAAPATRVWELVIDLERMGQWSPEYQGGEWLDGATGPVVGARFKGRNKRREREWESISTVLEAAVGRSFAWAVGNPPNPAATWRFDFTPEGAGTRVHQHVQLGPGPSGLTARIAELPNREEDIVAARTAELDLSQGCDVAFSDDVDTLITARKPRLAFSLGGMGSATTNFYNDAYSRQGWADIAAEVRRLWVAGKRQDAAALIPDAMVLQTTMIGTATMVCERMRAWRDAGITTLRVYPAGDSLEQRLATLGRAIELVEELNREAR